MEYIVDCSEHLLGRLTSEIAQQLLNGSKVVLLRCEEIGISGTEYRNIKDYLDKYHKRCNYNPKRGPFHFRTPAYIVHKTVRSMMPYKTYRGKSSLENLKCFEGIPPAYQKAEHLTIPCAMRAIRLKPFREFCTLGSIAVKLGWKHADDLKFFEDKRKAELAKIAVDEDNIRAKNEKVLCQNPKYVEISQKLAEYGL